MTVRPLHLHPRLEILRPSQISEHARAIMGRTALAWGERVGSPEGKHARKIEARRTQIDVGEAAFRAGYEGGLNTVPSLPPDDASKKMATQVIAEVQKRNTNQREINAHVQLYGRLPLITHGNAIEPRGPERPSRR